MIFKGSSDQNHFIFKSMSETDPTYNDVIQIQSRSISDTPLSGIDLKNKWIGSVLPSKKGSTLDLDS